MVGGREGGREGGRDGGREGGREGGRDPKHDKPNHLLHCPLSCLNNTERKIVLTATGLGLRTLMLEL